MMRAKWMLSIRTYTQRKDVIFKPHEGETDLQCYQRAKAQRDKLIEKYKGQAITIELISRAMSFKKPVNFQTPKGHMWCPYCIKARIFVEDGRLGIDRCSVCGISDQNYYVKKENGLWAREYLLYCCKPEDKK